MGTAKAGGDLDGVIQRLVRREAIHRDNVTKGLALNVFHRDELHPVIGARLIDAHDIRMVEGRCRPGLSQETLQPLRIESILRWQNLECHQAAKFDVERPVDNPHAAFANLLPDLVVANRAARQVDARRSLERLRIRRDGAEKAIGRGPATQQLLDLSPQPLIVSAGLQEIPCSFRRLPL